MMVSGQEVLLFDVRQPLDLLAYPELISGAKRIPPEEVLKTPSLLPRDEDIATITNHKLSSFRQDERHL